MKKIYFILLMALAALVAILCSVGCMSHGSEAGRPIFWLVGIANIGIYAAAIFYLLVKRDKQEQDEKHKSI